MAMPSQWVEGVGEGQAPPLGHHQHLKKPGRMRLLPGGLCTLACCGDAHLWRPETSGEAPGEAGDRECGAVGGLSAGLGAAELSGFSRRGPLKVLGP